MPPHSFRVGSRDHGCPSSGSGDRPGTHCVAVERHGRGRLSEVAAGAEAAGPELDVLTIRYISMIRSAV